MKKAVLSLIVCGTLMNTLQAQNVVYKVISDDPYDISNLNIKIIPYHFDFWGGQLYTSHGLRADATIINKFTAETDLRFGLKNYNQQGIFTTPNYLTTDKPFRYFNVYFGLQYFLFDYSYKGTSKVVFDRTYSGLYEVEKYTEIKHKKRMLMKLRAGINLQNLPNQIISPTGYRIQSKADPNQEYPVTFNGVTINNTNYSIYGFNAMNLFMFNFGFGLRPISNLDVAFEYPVSTKKNTYRFIDYYIDVLYAPGASFVDLTSVPDNQNYKIISEEFSNFGFRVGLISEVGSFFNINYGAIFEAGVRPQVTNISSEILGRLYLNIGAFIIIPQKLKSLN